MSDSQTAMAVDTKLGELKLEDGAEETVPLGKLTTFGYSRDFGQRYIQGKLLGHGQFGYTYVAIDKATDQAVAVKKIQKSRMVSAMDVDDVKREVKILSALAGHENVVQFHEAFEDDEFVYIVMELCEGGELFDRIITKKNFRYTEKDAAELVRQMLKVVASCHLKGIVHRDLKPENFLFKSKSDESPLKLTDFGLSDFIVPDQRFRDIVGSAYYIAPEVLRRNSGPESDVWSIGVITYILLSGRRPFWGKTETSIFKEVIKKQVDFSFNPWPNLSPSAQNFVKSLLVKDPKARATAAQALSHSWVREGGDAADVPLDISVLSNMREFVKYSRLKQLARRALGNVLGNHDIIHLRDQFNAIDIDKSGSITLDEIRRAFDKDHAWQVRETKILEILNAMDINGDGLVDFGEFVAATLQVHQMEELDADKWNQCTLKAFEMFDTDKNGFITPEELRVVAGLRGSLENILDDADTDNDGMISLHEFRKLLKQVS